MKFSIEEKKQILLWYENVSQDQMHYGNGTVLFPQEGILINKLKKNTDEQLSEYEINMIKDWMPNSKYLFGIELDLYNKLKEV